ncbi:MAG TPA: ABC transporter permease [Conexibacter sp.]|jgi:ribose transport system permease protein
MPFSRLQVESGDVGAVAAPRPIGEGAGRTLLRLLNRYSFAFAALLAAALLIANLLETSGNFGWTAQLANFAPMAIAAMASTPSILSGRGGFDLSISPVMIFTAAIYVAWLVPAGLDGPAAAIIMLLFGAGIGLINGLLIVGLRIPPVVATLSMYFILIGVNLKIVPSPVSVEGSWFNTFSDSIGPVPGALVTLAIPLLIWVGLGRTPYRKALYVVGSNDASAYSSGVNIGAVRIAAYALGGLMAGIAGIAVIAVSGSASASLSTTYALQAVASVALGGTSLLGGRGGLVGPLLGAASIFLLGNLLISLQVDPSWLQVMYGCMLVLAVVLVTAAGSSRRGAKA